jgi:hypothetical protein
MGDERREIERARGLRGGDVERGVPGLLQPPRLFCNGVHGPSSDLETWIVDLQ